MTSQTIPNFGMTEGVRGEGRRAGEVGIERGAENTEGTTA